MRKVSFGCRRREIGPGGKFQPYFSDHLNFPLESDGKQPKKEAVCRLFMEQGLHRAASFRRQVFLGHSFCINMWARVCDGGRQLRPDSAQTSRRRLPPAGVHSRASSLLEAGHQGLCGLLTVVFLPRSSGTRSAGASWCAGASRATSRPWTPAARRRRRA